MRVSGCAYFLCLFGIENNGNFTASGPEYHHLLRARIQRNEAIDFQ